MVYKQLFFSDSKINKLFFTCKSFWTFYGERWEKVCEGVDAGRETPDARRLTKKTISQKNL